MGDVTLPPGQRAVEGFPRFGVHLHEPPPPVPADPAIRIEGAVARPVTVPLARFADDLPRRELRADLHCVAGWSAVGLRWGGVDLRTLLEEAGPDPAATHVSFAGLDGHRSVLALEDALAGDALVADRLDGRPLDGDHGAPARFVRPDRYGFISTKHLCRIELHTAEPSAVHRELRAYQRLGLSLLAPHPRARVWEEERHRHLPAWAVRPAYRRLIAPIRVLSSARRRR